MYFYFSLSGIGVNRIGDEFNNEGEKELPQELRTERISLARKEQKEESFKRDMQK